jgi:hypothetical protein
MKIPRPKNMPLVSSHAYDAAEESSTIPSMDTNVLKYANSLPRCEATA